MKSNLALAQNVLSSDLYGQFKHFSKIIKKYEWFLSTGEITVSPEVYKNAFIELQTLSNQFPVEYQEFVKLEQNKHLRANRYFKHTCIMMLSPNLTFGTLTFSEETLSNTSADTRRRYVNRYLKSQNCYYIANLDFGSKNHREHYHFLANANISDTSWTKYGFCRLDKVKLNGELCRLPKDTKNDFESAFLITSRRLSRYTAKLSNHAIKETAVHSHAIFCRDISKILPTYYFKAEHLKWLQTKYCPDNQIHHLYHFVFDFLLEGQYFQNCQ